MPGGKHYPIIQCRTVDKRNTIIQGIRLSAHRCYILLDNKQETAEARSSARLLQITVRLLPD